MLSNTLAGYHATTTTTTAESTLAAERVRRHALDVDDAAMLLEMLGLAETPASALSTAPARRTRVDELVQAVAAADRLIHLRELRAQLGWPGVAVDVAASRAVRAGKLTRPKLGWYGLPGRDYPAPDTRPCGTSTAYHRGCRCPDCRAVSAEESRRRRARYRAQRVKIAGRLCRGQRAPTRAEHGTNVGLPVRHLRGSVPALQPETATRSPRRIRCGRRPNRLTLALAGPSADQMLRRHSRMCFSCAARPPA